MRPWKLRTRWVDELDNFQVSPAFSSLLYALEGASVPPALPPPPMLLALSPLVEFSQWEAELGDQRMGRGRG